MRRRLASGGVFTTQGSRHSIGSRGEERVADAGGVRTSCTEIDGGEATRTVVNRGAEIELEDDGARKLDEVSVGSGLGI
jgi:hypothetical protein